MLPLNTKTAINYAPIKGGLKVFSLLFLKEAGGRRERGGLPPPMSIFYTSPVPVVKPVPLPRV